VRSHSPAWLPIAAAVAIHIYAAVLGDILVVLHPPQPPEIAPHVELVEVEVAKPPQPPPPVKRQESTPVREEQPKARVRPAIRTQSTPEPATPPPPEPPKATSPDPGGDPVVSLDNIDPSVSGSVLVAKGKRNTGHVGQGGSGGGTGAGVGSGSGEAPKPVSVATIKKMPKPRGDYGYFAEYPAEARQLGIEGDIKVKLVVDATGKVASATLINRLGHGLDELALTRAREIEFEPALDTDNNPVTATLTWTFHMTLPK
jgi:periplasmic protein TonB